MSSNTATGLLSGRSMAFSLSIFHRRGERSMLTVDPISIPFSGGWARALLVRPRSGPIRSRVIFCGPHPLRGGSLDHPVVSTLARAIAGERAACLVWEYPQRQWGLTEEEAARLTGGFWQDSRILAGREADLRTLAELHDWMRDHAGAPADSLAAVAGYSYGAVLALLHSGGKLPVLAVSPPLRALPEDVSADAARIVLLRAEDDIAITAGESRAFRQRLHGHYALEYVAHGAEHHFHQRHDDLELVASRWSASFIESRVASLEM